MTRREVSIGYVRIFSFGFEKYHFWHAPEIDYHICKRNFLPPANWKRYDNLLFSFWPFFIFIGTIIQIYISHKVEMKTIRQS
jgi:hypothetical protein